MFEFYFHIVKYGSQQNILRGRSTVKLITLLSKLRFISLACSWFQDFWNSV